ncbi:BREX system ATP-binding domain-containing protein [Actinoplanes sp. NPDC023936]|uniref:BREX system ATP-binding domain-containing protein n=1 Tax=Actinoplanes sp. NPDC023936 TaxID=3154910 RepID=UPI0033F510AC
MNDRRPPPRFSDINPFPPTAVAQVSHIGAETVTIQTAAIRTAVAELQDYLASPGAGRVLAIVGNYGTGKSHLAVYLLNTARQIAGETVQQLFVNAPYGNFVSLYRAFAESLADRRELVMARVRHFYADVVADSMAGSELHAEIASKLRAGKADPVAVVEALGLPESGLIEEVQQRLRDITENKAFGTALTLLLRHGFEDAVWEWLVGNDPAENLRERGIVDPTTMSERSALDAMSVFAVLFRGGRFRFMVVIDELDHLLSASNRPHGEVQIALKQLLEGFLSAGAFLVLAGLPDFLESLQSDVRARITRQVTMAPLTAQDAVSYIRARQQSELGADRLFPFSEGVVSYIVDISGGSPRDVIRLCYQLYRRAADQDGAVTDAMVRVVARDAFYGPNTEATHRDIRRTLTAHGLTSGAKNFVDGVPVDYWIPIGSRGAAITVLVNDAVLDDSQLTTLISYVSRLRGAANREVLVVIGGYLSPEYTDRLREVLQRDPIIYEKRGFAADFDAALSGVERRLDRVDAADPAAALLARLERLGQQQSNTLDIVLDLAGRVESLATSSDQRIAELSRQFETVPLLIGGLRTDAGSAAPPPAGQLPERVTAVFDDAINALSIDTRLSTLFRQMFDDNAEAASARRLVTATLRQQRAHTATGVVTLLRLLTDSFRRAVTDWYATAETDEHGRLLGKHRQRFDAIIRVFDTFMGFLYVYEASWLADQLAGGEDARQGTLDHSIRATRLLQGQDELGGLSGRVRTEVLSDFASDAPG